MRARGSGHLETNHIPVLTDQTRGREEGWRSLVLCRSLSSVLWGGPREGSRWVSAPPCPAAGSVQGARLLEEGLSWAAPMGHQHLRGEGYLISPDAKATH